MSDTFRLPASLRVRFRTPSVLATCAIAVLGALMVVAAGCGGGGNTTDGDRAKPDGHWHEQDLIAALVALMGSDGSADPHRAFANQLGYELLPPDTNEKREERDLRSRITSQVQRVSGARGVITTTELLLWVGDGRGETIRDIEIIQPMSDEIAAQLEKHFGEPDKTIKPTGRQVGNFGRRKTTIWYREAWTVSFDPAAYRSTAALKLVHNGNWKPGDMDGLGTVDRPDSGGGTNAGGSGGTGGGLRPADRTPDGGSGSDGGGTSTDTAGVVLPLDRAADNAASMRVHERFIGAAARNGEATLRSRSLTWNDRPWMIANADLRSVQAVGGGGAKVSWEWDVMDGELRIALYQMLDDKQPVDYLGMAVHAYRESLDTTGDDLVRRVLERHPDRKADIDGFLARQRGMAVPRGGFTLVRDGRTWRFLAPAQMAERREQQELDELCERLEKALSSSRDADREQAEWLVHRLNGMNDAARVRALDLVAAERSSRMARLSRTHITSSIVRRLKQAFDLARKAAMEFIYNQEAYPYPSDTHEGQDRVDELVGEVRAMWENPAKAVVAANPELGKLVDEVRELEEYLRVLDPNSIGASSDTAAAFEQAVNERVDLQTAASGSSESSRYRQFDQVEADNNEGRSVATEAERAFVSILNRYRKMMGVGPLRINDHLTDAARKHSEYMAASGEFAHEIDGHPYGRTPRDRVSKAGYGGAVGENIFMGSPSPQSAFDGWFGSSGHHRNMLDPRWRVVGAGESNGYWTTVFGAAEDGSEPKARR